MGTYADRKQPELEDEIDFSYYRQTLIGRWKVLAVGAALGAMGGLTFAMMRPTLYEASTTVQVSQAPAAAANMVTARALIRNNTLAVQTLNETGLAGPPFNMTAPAFIEALAFEEIPGTSLMRVKARLPDAKKAADALTLLSHKAVELNSRLTSTENTMLRDQLQAQVDDAADRFQQAEEHLLKYRNEAQVEVLRADTEAMLDERGDLLKLLIDIETEKGRLAAAEQEIQKQPPVLSVPRLASSEEALRRAADVSTWLSGLDTRRGEVESVQSSRAERLPPPADSGSIDLSHPFVNPVYQTLAFQIATSRTRLAGLERARREMVVVRKLGEDHFRQLSELHRRELELAELQAKYELAAGVYSNLALRYEQSRTDTLSRMVLQVVDEAIPADQPLSKNHAQATGKGLVSGFAMAAVLALAWGAGVKTSDAARRV